MFFLLIVIDLILITTLLFIISCMLLDHGSEVNLNGGRAQQKVVLQTLMTTSIHYNVVSVVVENYVSDWILFFFFLIQDKISTLS